MTDAAQKLDPWCASGKAEFLNAPAPIQPRHDVSLRDDTGVWSCSGNPQSPSMTVVQDRG